MQGWQEGKAQAVSLCGCTCRAHHRACMHATPVNPVPRLSKCALAPPSHTQQNLSSCPLHVDKHITMRAC